MGRRSRSPTRNKRRRKQTETTSSPLNESTRRRKGGREGMREKGRQCSPWRSHPRNLGPALGRRGRRRRGGGLFLEIHVRPYLDRRLSQSSPGMRRRRAPNAGGRARNLYHRRPDMCLRHSVPRLGAAAPCDGNGGSRWPLRTRMSRPGCAMRRPRDVAWT